MAPLNDPLSLGMRELDQTLRDALDRLGEGE